MLASLDLLLPVGARPFDPAEPELVRWAVGEGLAEGLWVRDLPCVPAGDPDVGQGGDPFADLAHLAGTGLDHGVSTLGTASIILGLRHPMVVARAVTGLVARAHCRVVLGVGTGGKPAMNEALGVADRTMAEFVEQWTRLREAVRGTGDERSGDERTGDEGAGDERSGDERTGDEGAGDERTGDERTGDERTGDERTGDERTGDEGAGRPGPVGPGADAGGPTSFVVPHGYRPPDMHLATTDVRRWEAIAGDAEGWQTFLGTPEDYLSAREKVLAVTGGPLQVCVRADVTITTGLRAPQIGERGRVTCTVGQLADLLRTWRQLPVDHLLLSVRGADPLATLRTVREAVGG